MGPSEFRSPSRASQQTYTTPLSRTTSNLSRTTSNLSYRDPLESTVLQTSRLQKDRTQASYNSRSGRSMAGMMEVDRPRTRRDRTFVGSECAVCDEPLEHTLRGERVLQFSCGHVSHEACFYEYIKEFDSSYCPTCNAPLGLDTSRGGNVLDLGE